MKKLTKSKIAELKKLTDFRKVMLTSELDKAHAGLRKKEAEARELKKRSPSGTSIEDAAAIMLWQKWRTQELLRINATQAVMRVECAQIGNAVSKAIAEDATADFLRDQSKSEEKTRLRRRTEMDASHFLPDNISDQDI